MRCSLPRGRLAPDWSESGAVCPLGEGGFDSVASVRPVELAADLPGRPGRRVDVDVRGAGPDRRQQLGKLSGAQSLGPRRRGGGDVGLTSAAKIVPVIVAGVGGHPCVPAGPLPRFVHRNTVIPPLTPVCARWMWACCTSLSAYVSDHEMDDSSLLTFARNSPRAVVETDGTSS